jgi:uncharacterized protein YceH (UPF0502 family)
MDFTLTPQEIRVLGCLLEKTMATPEYYTLTLNALVNACNQKSNREPVVNCDEATVLDAVKGLTQRKMVFQSMLSRAPKYEECYTPDQSFIPAEAAILCVLMLRGPQTAGEIKGRTERMYAFENLEHVVRILENLTARDHVVKLARQPGRKEVRYIHRLGDYTDACDGTVDGVDGSTEVAGGGGGSDRLSALEANVDRLNEEVAALKQQLSEVMDLLK